MAYQPRSQSRSAQRRRSSLCVHGMVAHRAIARQGQTLQLSRGLSFLENCRPSFSIFETQLPVISEPIFSWSSEYCLLRHCKEGKGCQHDFT